LAPTGWRVATDTDWTQLTDFLGGLDVAGGKLKEIGLVHWLSPNSGATDEYGFRALPGGNRMFTGVFQQLGESAYIASSTEFGVGYWHRWFRHDTQTIERNFAQKMYGMSVRCMRDV